MLSSFEKICLGNMAVDGLVRSARSDGWTDNNYRDNSYFASFKNNLDAKGTMLEIRGFEKEGLSLLLYRHQHTAGGNVTIIGCDMVDMSGATEIDNPALEAAFGPLSQANKLPHLDASGLVMRTWLTWIKDPLKRIIYIRDAKDWQNTHSDTAGKTVLRASWDERR
jgi:hypothetical protein